MDRVLLTVNQKLFEMNRYKEHCVKFKTFTTDEQRIIYTFNLIQELGIRPESTYFKKDAAYSRFVREVGNEVFTAGPADGLRYMTALKAYSESIAFAPLRSKELALAYANRSAVLLRFKKYKECLGDIDRALSLDYPDNLKRKLLLRKRMCRKALGEPECEKMFKKAGRSTKKGSTKEHTKAIPENLAQTNGQNETQRQVEETEYPLPKITSCNPEIPFACDAITIEYDDTFGRHLVATRDIKPGEILFVEKPYAFMLRPDNTYTHCAKCLNVAWDSIPCDHCVHVVFCSEKCKKEAFKEFHDIECSVISLLLNLEMDILSFLGMRLAIIAMKKMGNSEALRKEFEIVDNWKDPRTRGYSDDGKFNGEDYRTVYSAPTNTDKMPVEDLFRRALCTTYILFFLATRTMMFGKKLGANLLALAKNPELTFVGGMIFRHLLIGPRNVRTFREEQECGDVWRGAVFVPFTSLCLHSCDPNVTRQSIKQHVVVYALQPIKKGGQLFSNYVPFFGIMKKDARQKRLKELFYYECKCRPCNENWPTHLELPSYTHWVTSSREMEKIEEALRNFDRYWHLVAVGDIKKEPNLLKYMFKVVEVLSESVPLPCIEMIDAIKAITYIEALQGNTFFIPDI
ncbi:SET and MYND domain-containing protein 4 [Orussus abietinus]|uniref:SET and MYND domain-containing protein 4 n=1 Tax=Orussus abietinus TaxID=222816 RepID=UPI000625E0C0|nr:SET and MYND domain-containing protein 4 [Orussus abietinus]